MRIRGPISTSREESLKRTNTGSHPLASEFLRFLNRLLGLGSSGHLWRLRSQDDADHYKGYRVSCVYDNELGQYGGKWEGTNHLICFIGDSREEAEAEFRYMIDGYLEDCAKSGETPEPRDENCFDCEPAADGKV